MSEIIETAITIDHETGRVRVDTTARRIKSKLERCEFERIKDEQLGPYFSYVGDSRQITFRNRAKVKGQVKTQSRR